MNIYCGCSGYHYDEWKDLFYPEDITKNQWLSYYAEHFNTVEINGSFYHLPKKSTAKNWKDQTPANFKFSVKGSRYITHQKKLKMDNKLKEAVIRFHDVMLELGEKLSCILWQLPGNLKANPEKLDEFCSLLDKNYHHVMEFREASWFDEEIYRILARHKVGCCAISTPETDLPEDIRVTSDIVYVRMHGKKEWYNYDYSKKELKDWLDKIKKTKTAEAYIYFNNTAHGYAVKNCQAFRKLVS